MEQLATLDTGFLRAEDSDPHVSLAIGVVAIVEGPAPTFQQLQTVLAERIRAIPRCTQVLRTHPFDVGAPQWVGDRRFDITHHVRRVALPRPGDDADLFGLIAHALERRLDRERPLWELWVIEGLRGNRWAILMKIHHCVADDVSGIQILTKLCDGTEGEMTSGPAASKKVSKSRPNRTRVFNVNPLRWAGVGWRASGAVTNAVARAVAGAADSAGGLIGPAGQTSLINPVSDTRRYRTVRVSLGSILSVCRKFDVSINDVALAAITEGFRAVLLHRGERPRADSLRTLVPMSARSTDAIDKFANRLSVMLPYLPVDQDDPVQRLRTVHDRLIRAKHSGQREAGSIFASVANVIPFVLSAWAIRLLTRLPHRGVVTLATNAPGPHHQLRVMGHEIERLLPIPPIAPHLRTGVAVLSYADDLVFGITTDYDAPPDPEELADGIELGVARLEALSRDSVLLFAR